MIEINRVDSVAIDEFILVLKTSTFSDLKEGSKFIYSEKTVLTLISLIGIISIFGISYITLLPVWADKPYFVFWQAGISLNILNPKTQSASAEQTASQGKY